MAVTDPAYRGFSPLQANDAPPPRVWTVFVAFVGALVSTGVFSLVVVLAMFAAACWRYAARVGAMPPSGEMEHAFRTFVLSAPGILGSGLAACLSFAVFALVPARLSEPGITARLRLDATPRWKTVGLVCAGATLGIGQVSSGVITLAGLEGQGNLGHIARAFAGASPGMLVGAALIVGLGAGVGEELLFRGYVLTRLAERWRPWIAVCVSAGLFALAHFDPLHSTFAFFVGLLLGWTSLRAGSIRPTLVAHVVNNLAGVVGMAVSDPSEPTPRSVAVGEMALGVLLVAAGVLTVRRITAEREA